MTLAKQENVSLDYLVENLQNLDFKPNEFDLLVLIYAHFPAELKSEFHKKLANYVKPGGHVVFEAFSKKHIEYNSVNPKAGGPKDVTMLFSVEEVSNDFTDFEIIQLQEKVVDLNEGKYHIGQSSVIQFVGRKLG